MYNPIYGTFKPIENSKLQSAKAVDGQAKSCASWDSYWDSMGIPMKQCKYCGLNGMFTIYQLL